MRSSQAWEPMHVLKAYHEVAAAVLLPAVGKTHHSGWKRACAACVLSSPSMHERVVYRPRQLPVKRDVPKFPSWNGADAKTL